MVSANPQCAYIGSASISQSWVGTTIYRAMLLVGLNAPDVAIDELEFSDEVVEGSLEPLSRSGFKVCTVRRATLILVWSLNLDRRPLHDVANSA